MAVRFFFPVLFPGLLLFHAMALDTPWPATLFGGESTDGGWPRTAICVDGQGDVIVAMTSQSCDLPTTIGAFANQCSGQTDMVVAKFDPEMAELLAATYLGGTGEDVVMSVTSFPDGRILITGQTSSDDFPVTEHAYATARADQGGAEYDAVLCVLSSDLSRVEAATFLGGNGWDWGTDVVLRGVEPIVVGRTQSINFPSTVPIPADLSRGNPRLFAVRFTEDLGTLVAATLFGRTCMDDYPSVALDSQKDIWIGGTTQDPEFPTTPGVWREVMGGGFDPYVVHLSGDLEHCLASSFLGGAGFDFAYDLTLDASDRVIVVCHVASSDFPTTQTAHDRSFNGGIADAAVVILDPDLAEVVAATFIGGTGNDSAMAVSTSPTGCIWVSGYTDADDFPSTAGAPFPSRLGMDDGFVAVLTSDLSELVAASYWGGTQVEELNALALHPAGHIVLAGSTSSSDCPIPDSAFDTSYEGGNPEYWGGDGVILAVPRDFGTPHPNVAKPWTQYLPHFARRPGEWSTRVKLTNADALAQAIQITAFSMEGMPIDAVNVWLPARGGVNLSVDTWFPGMSVPSGWLEIRSESPLLAGIMTFTYLPTGGTSSLNLTSQTSSRLLLPGLIQDGQWATGFALCNPSDSPNRATCRLNDLSGRTLASVTQNLAPRGKLVGMLDQVFDVPLPETCTLEITADLPLTGFALAFGHANQQIVAVPAALLEQPPTE